MPNVFSSPALLSIITIAISSGAVLLASLSKDKVGWLQKNTDDGASMRGELRTRVKDLEAECDDFREKYWDLVQKCAEERVEFESRIAKLQREHHRG